MCFSNGGGNSRAIAEQRAAEAQRQQLITAAVDRANRYFSGDSRSRLYDKAYQAAYDTNMGDLNQQRDDAARQLKFQLARASGGGSPQAAYMQDRLQQIYDKALERVGRVAESVRTGFQSSDNTTRANLVQQAQSGLSANQIPSLATTQLDANNNTWITNASEAQLGDVFSDLAQQWGQGQTLAGYRAGSNANPNEWLGTYNAGGSGGGGYSGAYS